MIKKNEHSTQENLVYNHHGHNKCTQTITRSPNFPLFQQIHSSFTYEQLQKFKTSLVRQKFKEFCS